MSTSLDSDSPPAWFVHLRQRSEFPLLVTGVVLALLLLAELVLAWIWEPTLGRNMVAGMVAEMTVGREGGIPVAIAAGVPPLLVWQVSVTQDVAGFCLAYPWFLMFYHSKSQTESPGFIMRRLQRIERNASRHQAFAHKWGPFGIFLFMLMPFLVNGPMVGGILGRLVGIRTRYLIAPVVASTMLASAAWVFFFDWTVGRLESIDPRFGYLIAAILFVGFFVAGVAGLLLDDRKDRRERDDASTQESDK